MKTRRYFQAAAITLAMIVANNAPAYCQSPQKSPAPPSRIQQVKDQVQKIGMGEDVTVLLFSGLEYYGAISKIESDGFEIAEVDLKQMVVIAYADVKEVEKGYGEMNSKTGKRQKNLKSRSGLILLLVGVGSAVALLFVGLSKHKRPEPAPSLPPFPPFPRVP